MGFAFSSVCILLLGCNCPSFLILDSVTRQQSSLTLRSRPTPSTRIRMDDDLLGKSKHLLEKNDRKRALVEYQLVQRLT